MSGFPAPATALGPNQVGTHANRPAASSVAAGYLYWETDTTSMFESDGASTWTQVGGGAGTVTSVTATDASIVVAGTATAPTIATGTLDVVATQHPPAANWSNNSKKVTALANGTAASDAAAFGQIPVPGNGYGITGNTGATPTPAVALTTVTSFITVDVSLGAASIVNITSASLAAGTWIVTPTMLAFNASASTVAILVAWLGDTSAAQGVVATLGQTSLNGTTGGDYQRQMTLLPAVLTPGSTTSYYWNAEANAAGCTAKATDSQGFGTHKCTGITALRIA